MTKTKNYEMTRDRLHDECSEQGFRKKESKPVFKTRRTKMDAADEKRNLEGCVMQDVPGIRGRDSRAGSREGGDGPGYHHACAW